MEGQIMKLKTAFTGFLIFSLTLLNPAGGEIFAAKTPVKASAEKSADIKTASSRSAKKAKIIIKKPIKGMGSWYSRNSPGVKRRTASGERFDDSKHTCALWHYPLGTQVRVTNLKTGKSVVCRVNDRGPSRRLKRRIIDMSRASFLKIGKLHEGLITVSVTPL